MNKAKFTTAMICRAGIIAALYIVLTMPFGELAFGPIQVRPSEALTLLPLFYVEAIPGLYVGCMLANVISGYGLADIFLGSLATLFAAGGTFAIGKLIKNHALRIILGGIFPVILNAFIIPAVWLIAGSDVAYWYQVAIFLLNEGIWVYALGIPLYFAVTSLIKRNVTVMLPFSLRTKKAKSRQINE